MQGRRSVIQEVDLLVEGEVGEGDPGGGTREGPLCASSRRFSIVQGPGGKGGGGLAEEEAGEVDPAVACSAWLFAGGPLWSIVLLLVARTSPPPRHRRFKGLSTTTRRPRLLG